MSACNCILLPCCFIVISGRRNRLIDCRRNFGSYGNQSYNLCARNKLILFFFRYNFQRQQRASGRLCQVFLLLSTLPTTLNTRKSIQKYCVCVCVRIWLLMLLCRLLHRSDIPIRCSLRKWFFAVLPSWPNHSTIHDVWLAGVQRWWLTCCYYVRVSGRLAKRKIIPEEDGKRDACRDLM